MIIGNSWFNRLQVADLFGVIKFRILSARLLLEDRLFCFETEALYVLRQFASMVDFLLPMRKRMVIDRDRLAFVACTK